MLLLDVHLDHFKVCPFHSLSKGALTTFIGVAALAFAQSEAYRIFFKMFVGIIVIAMAHGVILTPALLGECRFIYRGIGYHDDKTMANTPKDEVSDTKLRAKLANGTPSSGQVRDGLGLCAVIGGNGFLGCYVVQQLAENGHPVRVLDIHKTLDSKLIGISNVEYARCDITNRDDVDWALQHVVTIIHWMDLKLSLMYQDLM